MREKMQRRLIWSSVVLAGLGLMPDTAEVSAATVTLAALKDAMIFGTSANADTNNASGKGPALFAGADGSSNKKRSMLVFDIAAAGIPAGSTITNVTMTLSLGQVAGSGGGQPGGNITPRVFHLYDLLQNWGEGNSGSPTSPSIGGTGQGYTRITGDTSWDYALYDSANPATGKWNAGGSDLHGGNFSVTASATVSFNSPFTVGSAYNFSSAGMVADVQAWLDNTSPNYGWLLQTDLETTATSFLGFWSREGAAANTDAGSDAPALSITYVPEPSSLALAMIGAATILRRRRRKE